MTQINNYVVGAALALAIAAFVLALWPAVADAPWEETPAQVVGAPAPADASAPQPEATQEDRSETCADLINLGVSAKGGLAPLVQAKLFDALLENDCLGALRK